MPRMAGTAMPRKAMPRMQRQYDSTQSHLLSVAFCASAAAAVALRLKIAAKDPPLPFRNASVMAATSSGAATSASAVHAVRP